MSIQQSSLHRARYKPLEEALEDYPHFCCQALVDVYVPLASTEIIIDPRNTRKQFMKCKACGYQSEDACLLVYIGGNTGVPMKLFDIDEAPLV